jgi:hypothetical protein
MEFSRRKLFNMVVVKFPDRKIAAGLRNFLSDKFPEVAETASSRAVNRRFFKFIGCRDRLAWVYFEVWFILVINAARDSSAENEYWANWPPYLV